MKILITIEDKTFGEAVIQFVCNHRWPQNTTFRIIHVVEPLYADIYVTGYPPQLLQDLLEEHRTRGESLVKEAGTTLKQSFKDAIVEEIILDGIPKEEIINTAKRWGADLIVVGSHGRRGISRFLLGSVSTAVLSHAPCSVIVVKIPAS